MAAKEPNDIQDEVEFAGSKASGADTAGDAQLMKRARRRLVGASALVLLAIIVLPLIMDREPAPVTPEISVRIPNPDNSGLATKITPPVTTKPTPAPQAQIVESRADAASTTSKEAVTSPADVTAKTAIAPVVSNEPSTEVKDKTAVAKKEEKPAAPDVAVGPAKSADPKEVSATSPSGKWEVQLGAYQSASNVNLLMSKLKELKVPAYTEKFDTPQGPRTRVRAGPFATKEAALAAQKRVRIIGVEGPVAPSSK